MRLVSVLLPAMAFSQCPLATFAEAGHAAPSPTREFAFSFLPKSFQRNPRLDFYVLTEMTQAGRKQPEPSSERPYYYVAHVSALDERGPSPVNISSNAPTVPQIEKLVSSALRPNHYLAATQHNAAPQLLLLVHWGFYSSPDAFPIEEYNAIIDRACLIGGTAFAKEFIKVLESEYAFQAVAASSDRARGAALQANGSTTAASSLVEIVGPMSPLVRFSRLDPRNEAIIQEVLSESYYVIVSALDYDSVAQKKPVLLWRTKLSLNSIGVSASESLPRLIHAGSRFFGRETNKTVILTGRLGQDTYVNLGEASVKEYIEPAEEQSNAAK